MQGGDRAGAGRGQSMEASQAPEPALPFTLNEEGTRAGGLSCCLLASESFEQVNDQI